ncbi:TonB-dependent receptor [Prevotella sp.]|uniref:TonB-dependent receptor n=1 Tax=Prevotella sp. TaxID=59823 RepID=UPI002F93C0BF
MKKIALILAATACLSATHAAPKEEKIDTLRTYELQNVEVLSTRAGRKTPVAYTTMDKQQIKKLNHGHDIPFLLSLTPGVTTTSDAGNGIGYTSIKVRGTDPSRINITANGIPINDAESSQVFFVNMGDFMSSVKDVQIQRGVGTSTNGSAAFGATINMQTDAPSLTPFITLSTAAGSYGTHKESLLFGSGLLADHWSFNGRLSNIGSNGYIDRASTNLNSYFLQGAYTGTNTMVKLLTFNGTEKTYMAWDYATKEQMEKFGRRYNPCGEYTDVDGKTKYYSNQTDNYHQQNYQLIWNQLLGGGFNFNIGLHYTAGFGYYEQYKAGAALADYGFTGTTLFSDIIRRKNLSNDFYGAVYAVNYKRGRWDASVGGAINRYSGRHFGNVISVVKAPVENYPDTEYYRNKAEKSERSFYGKVNVDLWRGLSAYVDLQYRHIDYRIQDPNDNYSAAAKEGWLYDEHYDFFNPKAGLFYQFNPNHMAYASFAISHREPTRNDFEGNPTPKPKAERMTDWELGYKYQSERLSAAINLYHMDYKDQFVLTGEINAIGEMIHRNVGSSYREGIELQAAWKPLDWFKWDANASFSKNRAKDWTVKSDNGKALSFGTTHLSFSPDVIFNNIFTFSYKGIEAGLQSQYIGKQYMTNDDNENLTLDDYCVTNLDLSYTFKLKSVKSITVGATVYNLFSKKYFTNGYASAGYNDEGKESWTWAAYSPQAPINFLAHLSITL